jgi:hypothetical protein
VSPGSYDARVSAVDDGTKYRALFNDGTGSTVPSSAATLTVHFAPLVTREAQRRTPEQRLVRDFVGRTVHELAPVGDRRHLHTNPVWPAFPSNRRR